MRRQAAPALPSVQSDSFIPSGGLDEITPPLQLTDGACTLLSNFEQGIRGGYRRIDGYERWSGNIPTAALRFQQMQLTATSGGTGTWQGYILEGVTSGARAVVAGGAIPSTLPYLWGVGINSTPTLIHVFNVAGQFIIGEQVQTVLNSGTTLLPAVVAAAPSDLTASTALEYATAEQNAIDTMRVGVRSPTNYVTFTNVRLVGIGAIGTTVYVFTVSAYSTDDARLDVWKPSTVDPREPPIYAGWTWEQVETVFIDGTDPIFPTEPERMDLVEYNFEGATDATSLWGVTGIGKAFQFDGTAFTQVDTGMATDTPTRIAIHKDRLFLAFGASLQFSPAADPLGTWTPVLGAGEIAMGEPITAMATVVGSDASSALLVGTNRGCAVLYGDTTSTFNLVWLNREMGMRADSLQIMSTPLFVNDYGVTSLAASQAFGNFEMATISQSVQRFIRTRLQRVTCSVLVRSKNQYRVFFNDGTGLYFTFKGTKLAAITPVRFDRVVRRIWSTLDYAGAELILFTSDDPMVYRMDTGRSFDGQDIDAYMVLSFNHMRSPRLRKAFRRASLEIECERGYVAFQAGGSVDHGGPSAMQSPETAMENQLGALWDELTWDQFVWDAGGRQPSVLPLDGTGKNLAIWMRCNSKLVESFALTGVMTEYLPRRLER